MAKANTSRSNAAAIVNPFINFVAETPKVKANTNGFITKRQGETRKSEAVKLKSMMFDRESGEIRVFDMDDTMRRLKVERLAKGDPAKAKKLATALWEKLAKAGKDKTEVIFVAAGGFSPDVWFCNVELGK